MFDYDRSDFITYLKDFPEQISKSLRIMKDFSFKVDVSNIRNIVLTGMGGSAISGELLLAYIHDELSVPAFVSREYSIPNFVNEHTLFIASTYSGETEETITATKKAIERSGQVVGISSGGAIEQICLEEGIPFIKIPGNIPPRQALGYLFFPLLVLFEKSGFISPRKQEIAETREMLYELAERYNPETSFGHNLANHIAQSIYHAIPVVYTGVPYLYPVPTRWRNQFNENSKSMAFGNVFP